MSTPTIIIPEGNEFIYCLTVREQNMADATDLHVFANNGPLRSRELFVSCDKNIIRIPFRNLKRGLYNVWVSFRLNGRLVSLSYNNAFSIVEWNNAHTNWEKYKQGSELSVESGFYISGNINSGDWNQLWNEMSQFEDLKQECRDAAANANRAAEYAKQEGDCAKKVGEGLLADAEAGKFNGKDGYTPIKDVDYFDGEKGDPGEPGKDGSLLYPKVRVENRCLIVRASQKPNWRINNRCLIAKL